MRSADQVQRLIQLVPYLTQNPGVTVTEVARDFRTTPAVILRDLEVIQFCGLPGGLTSRGSGPTERSTCTTPMCWPAP